MFWFNLPPTYTHTPLETSGLCGFKTVRDRVRTRLSFHDHTSTHGRRKKKKKDTNKPACANVNQHFHSCIKEFPLSPFRRNQRDVVGVLLRLLSSEWKVRFADDN